MGLHSSNDHAIADVDLVVAFCGGVLLREEGDRVEDYLFIGLGQYSCRDLV